MSFLAPLFLAGALAAAIPIILHLLKREPEGRVRFTAVRLLTHAPVERTSRRRLRELLLLAMRVAALLLLAFAFARPFVPAGAASPSAGITVLALDASLSMSAAGMMDEARRIARQQLAQVPGGDLAAVLAFERDARVIAGPSLDRRDTEAAIDRVTTGLGATSYAAAIDAASALFDGRKGRLVVITDLQESGWREGDSATLPQSATLDVIGVGPVSDNLAVLAARPAGDRIDATVSNSADTARDARVSVTVDGKPAGEALVAIPARQSAQVTLPVARGNAAVVTVDDAQGVAADNSRYVLLHGAQRPRVAVVTATGDLMRDAFYLQHALAARGASAPAYSVEGVSAAALAASGDDRPKQPAAIVLLSTRGLDRGGRERIAAYVTGGGGLFVAAGPEIDPEVLGGALAGRIVVELPAAAVQNRERTLAAADARHPVFRVFPSGAAAVGLPTFRRVASIAGERCTVLARFTSGEPGLLECEVDAGRVMVFASDLSNAWNNFPLHTSFVPFIQETVDYLAGRPSNLDHILVGDAPAEVSRQPGFVRGPDGTEIAVNVDPAEADTSRMSPDNFRAAVTRLNDSGPSGGPAADAQRQESAQRLWQYLLALMIGMLLVESFVGARTA